jgi:Skp family chaperone for outer membrane proteins
MTIRRSHLLLLCLAGLTGAGLLSLTRSEAQVAGSTGGTVAVCNIVEVFKEYQRAQDETEKLNQERNAFAAEAEKRKKRLESLQNEAEGFKPGSQAHEDALQRMQKEMIEFRVWEQFQQNLILRKHRRLTEEMYEQIKDAIAQVAKEQGYAVVVQLESGQLQARNVEELIAQIDRRKVLYHADSVDITATVLQKVNETYRISKP